MRLITQSYENEGRPAKRSRTVQFQQDTVHVYDTTSSQTYPTPMEEEKEEKETPLEDMPVLPPAPAKGPFVFEASEEWEEQPTTIPKRKFVWSRQTTSADPPQEYHKFHSVNAIVHETVPQREQQEDDETTLQQATKRQRAEEDQPRDWTCQECQTRNPHDESSCQNCKKRRASTIIGWGNVFGNLYKNMWKCASCDSHNDNSLNVCKSCNTERPGSSNDNNDTPAATTTSEPAPASGIIFGVPPTTTAIGGLVSGGTTGPETNIKASSGGFQFGTTGFADI